MVDQFFQRDARFMRSVLAASDDCIKVLRLDGTLTFMSEGGQRVLEISDFNTVKGCPWPDFWQGEGNEKAKAAVASARAGRSARFQGSAQTYMGNPRHWDVQVSPIMGADGQVESILSVSRDITSLKNAEEQQRLLALELKHRIKNTIAMIQAIANQTFRTADTVADAKNAFMTRLGTLSAAQDLLTQSSWSRAQLQELVPGVLGPHDDTGRISISGPVVHLSSKCALAMALALHELATNAVKYGALSNEDGHVDITWKIDGEASPPMLHFIWQESGGPPVSVPTSRGFGTLLIERALPGYFGGKSGMEYTPEGLIFRLDTHLHGLAED